MTDITPMDYQLYSDHVHTAHIPHRSRPLSRHPATVVNPASQHAWYESREAVVRRELEALNCEETVVLYGVTVQRSDAYARVTFHVNNCMSAKGTLLRYPLTEAVALVCAAAESGVRE